MSGVCIHRIQPASDGQSVLLDLDFLTDNTHTCVGIKVPADITVLDLWQKIMTVKANVAAGRQQHNPKLVTVRGAIRFCELDYTINGLQAKIICRQGDNTAVGFTIMQPEARFAEVVADIAETINESIANADAEAASDSQPTISQAFAPNRQQPPVA